MTFRSISFSIFPNRALYICMYKPIYVSFQIGRYTTYSPDLFPDCTLSFQSFRPAANRRAYRCRTWRWTEWATAGPNISSFYLSTKAWVPRVHMGEIKWSNVNFFFFNRHIFMQATTSTWIASGRRRKKPSSPTNFRENFYSNKNSLIVLKAINKTTKVSKKKCRKRTKYVRSLKKL